LSSERTPVAFHRKGELVAVGVAEGDELRPETVMPWT
jgi:hypothetical protein